MEYCKATRLTSWLSPLLTVCCILTMTPLSSGADPSLTPVTVTDSHGNTADGDSTIRWAPLPRGLAYHTSLKYDDGGLTPLYDFAKHFVNTVQPNPFPYDIVKGIKNGFSNYLSTNRSTVLKYELGFIVCLVLGIVFVIAMPVIGLIFCLCRLCGNCGGEMMHSKDSSSACLIKVLLTACLTVLTVFLAVGMICSYVNNDRMNVAVNEVKKNVHTNLDDMSSYMNNTIGELKFVAHDNFMFTIKVIERDLNNIGYMVGVPVRDRLGREAGITRVFDNVLNFTSLVVSVSSSLTAIDSSINALKRNGKNLADVLTTVKADIDSAKANTTSCIGCTNINTDKLKMDANYTALPDISGELRKMQDVMSQDISATVNKAKVDFENIPERVTNDSKQTVNGVKDLLNNFTGTIDEQMSKVDQLPVEASNNISSLKSDLDTYQREFDDYDQYRWVSGVILTCTILVVVVLQILGVMFGCLGHEGKALPSQRSSLSNCGGLMLMAATGFIFIFSWLLMTLTTISFILGGNFEKLFCEPLTDPKFTVFKKLIDEPGSIYGKENEYFMGSVLLQNGSIPLTLSGVLSGCRRNGGAYSVFMLDHLFDLDTVVNYRNQIDIGKEIDSMNIDFSSVTLLTPDLQKQLSDFSSAVQIDYQGFKTELSRNTTQEDLLSFASKLRSASQSSSEPSKTKLRTAATDLEITHNGIYATVKSDQAKLLAAINTLQQTTADIPTSVNVTLNSVSVAESYLKANGSTVVKEEAVSYTNRILGIADSFANNTLTVVKHDVGKCIPVWNLWESMIHISLCKYIMDTFNGFWFSIGWCLFFMVPSIIFNVRLAKYLRRMDLLETYDTTNKVGPRP